MTGCSASSELRQRRAEPAFRRPRRGRTHWILAGAAVAVALASTAYCDDDAQLKRIVDKIAKGDVVESADATEQLIELMTAPLADAIGSLEKRSVEEQVRLREALARLDGALRTRVFRLDLPAEDLALFDQFAAAYPDLTRRAFDGNYRVRIAAVHDIPLEPDSGAGVLLAAKVNDEDSEVAQAALAAAARLHDRVVARNLTRYIRDATATVKSGFYGSTDQDLALVVSIIVYEAIKIIADADQNDALPDIIAGLSFFGRSAYWDESQRADVLRILGRLGDPRADPVVLSFVDDARNLRHQRLDNGKRITETVGDVAARALMRIHKLQPEEFGMAIAKADPELVGYFDDDARRAGHRALLVWRQQHATSQPAPASQPANAEND